MSKSFKILHITPFVGRVSFGIGPIVLNLAAAQQALGHCVSIWCYDSPSDARQLEISYALRNRTIHSFPVLGPSRLGYSPKMEWASGHDGYAHDIAHQHGIWTGASHALNRWRAQTGRPTIIAPQGSLQPWALRRSRWKKRLALMLYEHRNLHDVSCMQALSTEEATDFRRFGLVAPIAIIPNGVSESWISHPGEASRFREKYNLPEHVRILLFLGRITPKKGLPMLLHAMQMHREELGDWRLLVAGVDEFNHEQEVRTLVQGLALQPYVQFIGPQFDLDKRDAFSAADAFVLPSHSEGAPVAILEALGSAVPVLTTKASPWEELIINGCGWWTDISVDAIARALKDLLCQPPTVLHSMGESGRRLVSEKYSWPGIAEQTLILYESLLDNGPKPTSILLE